jgi:transmembrane sensor
MKSFDDVPVREVIAEVNRQSAVRIELADPAVGDRRVDLDLHVGDANDVADGLAGYLGLTVDRSRPGLLLLRPTSR